MKKTLLFLATAALTASSAFAADQAQEPQSIGNVAVSQVSPDGKWGVSMDIYSGALQVINLETGDIESYEPDPDNWADSYDLGSGNCVSNTGIVLMTTTYNGTASYIKDGEILDLPVPEDITSAFSNGITPDAKRIVGSIGIEMSLDAEDVMQKPVLWELQDDGTYVLSQKLPYPSVDWTGRLPQYILTNAISADGKVIIGQVHDYQGTVEQPIVWREDASGNWTYELLHPELLNPNGVVFPEDPGDSPRTPQATDFMTEEEAEEYKEACDSWDWSTGDPYPEAEEYMTDEEWNAYQNAMEEYDAEYAAWWEKYEAFDEAIYEAQQDAMLFSMNSTIISPNGRYYATMSQYNDWWDPEASYSYPVVFDLQSGQYYTYKQEGITLAATYINNDGVLLGAAPAFDYLRNIYISDVLGKPMTPFQDWIELKNPELYAWLSENCVHDVPGYVRDEETDDWIETIFENQWCTGTPVANADFTTIYSWVTNDWDYEDFNYYYSYVLPLGAATSYSATVTIEGQFTSFVAESSENSDDKALDFVSGDYDMTSVFYFSPGVRYNLKGENENNTFCVIVNGVELKNQAKEGETGYVASVKFTPGTIIKIYNYVPASIENVEADSNADGRIFNMQGIEMKADHLTPGIYIQNGKKFIVR